MKILWEKFLKTVLIGLVLSSLALGGCALGGTTGSPPGAPVNQPADNTSPFAKLGSLTITGYPYGRLAATAAPDTAYLQSEYEAWKSAFVTAEGAGGNLRVKRDAVNKSDTVSEGIGYGMLLAVYFNDQKTFDGLFGYCQAHSDSNSLHGLMHWKVDKDGNNVSEFADYEIDTANMDQYCAPSAKVPHGHVFMNKANGKIIVLKTQQEIGNDAYFGTALPGWNAKTDFYQYAGNSRQLSAAIDADEDIAAALCFARVRWFQYKTGAEPTKYNYLEEAKAYIKAIKQFEVTMSAFIKAGNTWGDEKCWNPSYFTPAWYRVFAALCPEDATFWNALIDNMFKHMDMIGKANGTAGLFPDWCDTSSGSVQKTTGGDRQYLVNGALVKLQSFNYYYDAVRVPWRMAVFYSWYGDARGRAIVDKISAFFKPNVTTLVDGYAIDGSAWNWDNRDGFNDGTGGRNHTATFVAMNATAAMASNDDVYASQFWDETVNVKDSGDYTYFGNTLRLLSLLYLSGNFINYCDVRVTPKAVSLKTIGPLTIDTAYASDYGVYGIWNARFNDGAKLFNSDGTGYASIGEGAKTDPDKYTSILELGVYAHVGDIYAGGGVLWLREDGPHVAGNIYSRGPITGYPRKNLFTGIKLERLGNNADIGQLDFRVDPSGFLVGGTDIIIPAPGGYSTGDTKYWRDVVCNPGTSLTFSQAGKYYFNSFSTETDVKLYFPIDGKVIIFIKGKLVLKSRTKMLSLKNGQEVGANPANILIVSGAAYPAFNDSGTVYIAPQVSWRGTLIVPNYLINLDLSNDTVDGSLAATPRSFENIDLNGDAYGAFWASQIEVHQRTTIYFVPLDWSQFN